MSVRRTEAAGTRTPAERVLPATGADMDTNKEKIMNIRIAILAACAGTFALAQADVAQANYSAASGSKTLVKIADVGSEPAIVVAQGAAIITSRSNIKHPSQKAGPVKPKKVLPSAAINTSRSNIKHPSKTGGNTTR